MPFVKKIITDAGILGIWEIKETAQLLETKYAFSENEKLEYDKLKSDKRKIEFVAVRLLIQKILHSKHEIKYLDSGKPVLLNCNQYISISHSKNLVVVMVSDQKVGIDVELCNRDVERASKRFLSTGEKTAIQITNNRQIATIIYWGAKESIFKCTDYQGIRYHQQIHISPFPPMKEGEFAGKLIVEEITEHYKLWYFEFRNNMVVFCVEDKNNNE